MAESLSTSQTLRLRPTAASTTTGNSLPPVVRSSSSEASLDAQAVLHLFESDSLGLGVGGQHNEKLHHHHASEEDEGIRAGRFCELRECVNDNRVHDPVRRASKALPFGTHEIWKDFADINPDDRTLRNREKGDIRHQKPEQITLMTLGEKHC